jgi:hypothetical protein
MPRKSAAALSVLSVDGAPARLTPPPTLNDDAKRVFIDILCSLRPEHFQPAGGLLLARYAECAVMAGDAATELSANGPVTADGKPSPWVSVHAQMVKAMIGLAHRLKLSPQSRSPTNPLRQRPLSYYDRMALERSAAPLPSVDDWKEK